MKKLLVLGRAFSPRRRATKIRIPAVNQRVSVLFINRGLHDFFFFIAFYEQVFIVRQFSRSSLLRLFHLSLRLAIKQIVQRL